MEKVKYKIKFQNEEMYRDLRGYMVSTDIVGLSYPDAKENLSGFVIYDSDGQVAADCSDYIFRWDVLEANPDRIYYTNSADNVQTKKFDTENQIEEADPLTNEELTEAIADLMCEVSMMQLNI